MINLPAIMVFMADRIKNHQDYDLIGEYVHLYLISLQEKIKNAEC